jgi:hypothetical protein
VCCVLRTSDEAKSDELCVNEPTMMEQQATPVAQPDPAGTTAAFSLRVVDAVKPYPHLLHPPSAAAFRPPWRGLHMPLTPARVTAAAQDYYMAEPVENLDVCESDIRSKQAVIRVPVMRVFGSTPSGQRACLHLHRVRESRTVRPAVYPLFAFANDTDGAHTAIPVRVRSPAAYVAKHG